MRWHGHHYTCPGKGTTQEAECVIDYIAVEKNQDCRKVILRVFNQVRLARPGLFTRKDIFRYGHDVLDLVHRRRHPTVQLLITGVPCQPFSRAKTDQTKPPLGLYDT